VDPKSVFPQNNPDAFAITTALIDKVKGSIHHHFGFRYPARNSGHGFLVQGAYVDGLSRRSLIKDDLAMATNLVDPRFRVSAIARRRVS